MVQVLVHRVQILAFSLLGRSKQYCSTVLEAVFSYVHLDEVQVFLQQLCLLSVLTNDIDFVADNDDRDAKVNLQDALSQWHIKPDVSIISTHV